MALQEKIQEANIKAAVVAKKKADEDKRKAKKAIQAKIKADKERRKAEREKSQSSK